MPVLDKINMFHEIQTRLLNGETVQDEEITLLNRLAAEFMEITKNTYDNMALKYADLRTMELKDIDIQFWTDLFACVNKVLGKDLTGLKMLEAGTGNGRDIKYASEKGINVIGIDNSEGVLEILKRLENEKVIPKNSFQKANMLDIPFKNETFDIIRHCASLVHMPITIKGKMLDKVISESYRILKHKGITHIIVKEGKGINYIDTKEGLGGRIFQLHTEESIRKVLERNKFKIIKLTHIEEKRPESAVKWITIIAQKL